MKTIVTRARWLRDAKYQLSCDQCLTGKWKKIGDMLIGIAEVMGSNPVESPEFFRFMRQLLKLSSKCEDHIFI